MMPKFKFKESTNASSAEMQDRELVYLLLSQSVSDE